MVAGWSAYFKQKYGIAIFITAGIMGILLYLTFLNNIDGIMKISSYIGASFNSNYFIYSI